MAKLAKLYKKPAINSAITLALLTKLGIGILKHSANADIKIKNEELSEEALALMLMSDVDNELSKSGGV